ncbi:MAG: hypothetical protein JWP92_2547 [Caulobacter sp.]|nr:hypothetical protein [Caulobacter sp.]
MPYRERSAWISLSTTLVVYGAYFTIFARSALAGRPIGLGGAFTLCVIVLVALQIGLHIAAAILAPGEPRLAEDERERLITLRAATGAFYVFQVAVMAAVVTVYFADKIVMANAVLGALAVSELARHGGVILGYRRCA